MKFDYKPYLLIDVRYAREQQRGTSAFNKAEIDVIMSILRHVSRKVSAQNIGVVTPYKIQKLEIKRRLPKEFEGVSVDTVDGFQGCEKDIIIISTVRTEAIGFLRDERRMNVALTRAKYALYVVGKFSKLREDANWNSLIIDGEKRGLTLSLSSDKNIDKVISKILDNGIARAEKVKTKR